MRFICRFSRIARWLVCSFEINCECFYGFSISTFCQSCKIVLKKLCAQILKIVKLCFTICDVCEIVIFSYLTLEISQEPEFCNEWIRRKLWKIIKWDASSRWSLGPNSEWGSIETTPIRKTHPTLFLDPKFWTALYGQCFLKFFQKKNSKLAKF